MTTTVTTTLDEPTTRRDATPGQRLLTALASRDFATIEGLLTDDVWLRALLPRHLDERYGAGETTRAFRTWFGAAEDLEVLRSDHTTIVGKNRVTYRFSLRPDWAPETRHVIEQTAILSVVDGRIRKIDLVCSGFLPAAEEAVVSPNAVSAR